MPGTLTTSKWIRVSRASPCPICRRPDWCGVAADGSAAICMRVESERPARNGGWLHRLEEAPFRMPPPPPRRKPHDEPDIDFGPMHATWAGPTQADDLAHLAYALGVASEALRRLGAAWAPPHRAWAFPMRDGAGAVIGIRLRADDGRKWAVRGSRAGLIYEPVLAGTPPLLVCEGPTDTAAAMTLGFAAVGRPSCRGQEDLLRRLLRKWQADVVIVADCDEPKTGGARPGLAGARDLAVALRRPCKIIVPPCKDIRQWLQLGAKAGHVTAAINDAAWQNVR